MLPDATSSLYSLFPFLSLIIGKIASFGSLLRLDAISLGIFPEQQESAVITPSQKRVRKAKNSENKQLKKEKLKSKDIANLKEKGVEKKVN